MNIIHNINHINPDIMKRVDFEENSLYLTVCGKIRYNVYNGEKKSTTDATTSVVQNVEKHTKIKPRFNYIRNFFGCQDE